MRFEVSTREQRQSDATEVAAESLPGERLVRVPIDELRQTDDKI